MIVLDLKIKQVITYIKLIILCIFGCMSTHHTTIKTRSIHRPVDPLRPTIVVRWENDTQSHFLSNEHLEEWALFNLFDESFFNKHLLPESYIEYRNHPEKTVPGQTLVALLQQLFKEIEQQKKEFTDFIVLRRRNFNKKLRSGILVLKFKEYPFVVKVFMENPKSLVSPFEKGWEPCFQFFMGGGASRFFSGFTRIPNLMHIKKQIAKSPYWSSFVETPRKWFWKPTNGKWLEITGNNINKKGPVHISIPATYCIIADAIESERTLSLQFQHDRQLALSLCNYLDSCLDAHIDNFIIEKGTKKLIIVDTEHFPTMVGLKHKPKGFKNYGSWFLYLGRKCTKDMFFRTKRHRGRSGTPFDMQHITASRNKPTIVGTAV